MAPAGASAAPRSIAETVALLNALPKPVTLPCFLESLARPLSIYATRSIFSAQPAEGARSPRVFLALPPNLMSIAIAGEGAALLEFGEQRPQHRSLKAELVFPINAPIAASEPYERVIYSDDLTNCGFCHASEEQDLAISGSRAFVSAALRPESSEQVSVAALQAEQQACDHAAEAERCATLEALLSWGPVTDWSFPADMATFFD